MLKIGHYSKILRITTFCLLIIYFYVSFQQHRGPAVGAVGTAAHCRSCWTSLWTALGRLVLLLTKKQEHKKTEL